MKRVLIEIGTNINQRDNARLVREDLYAKFGENIHFTPSLKTKPVDGGDGYYINFLAEIHTDIPYDELRAWFKELEQECGRNKEDTRDGWVPLDIDILEYDGKRFCAKDWDRNYVKELLKTIVLVLFVFLLPTNTQAQQFDDYFDDATLRIDYTFSGDIKSTHIYLDKLNRIPRWYGKRERLAEVPMEGNGQIVVKSRKNQNVIYRNSFSTLYQEWLTSPEAESVQKSFENVFLVPMPKDTVDITVNLMDNRRQIVATMTHTVVPTDILIHRIGERDVTPYEVIHQPKDTARCIHIAYIAEGYTEEEMPIFMEDVRIADEALFAHEPFKSLQERFEVVAVKAASKESGTSEPANGLWRKTALGSHFNTFYSDRYLTTLNLKQMHDLLAGIPYEHIIVLVNTSHYGGGGILNSYNLSMTHHRLFRPVVVHEFGHSFAGLADEYAYEYEPIPMYPADVEPWEKNITTKVDFRGKWEELIGNLAPTNPRTPEPQKIGFYEGAGYSLKGVYRGCEDCRMRTNENPEFCPVCRKVITEVIDFYTK